MSPDQLGLTCVAVSMMQGGSAAHACVVLSVMLSLEGCYVSGAASNHLVSSCCLQHGISVVSLVLQGCCLVTADVVNRRCCHQSLERAVCNGVGKLSRLAMSTSLKWHPVTL